MRLEITKKGKKFIVTADGKEVCKPQDSLDAARKALKAWRVKDRNNG